VSAILRSPEILGVHTQWHAEREQAALQEAPYNVWPRPDDGEVWTSFHRSPDGYWMRFPARADFLIDAAGGWIEAWPAPGADPTELEHLWQNQVLPMALGRAGFLVFHGSAVAWEGAGLAFIGPSGHGKSTLAAAAARRGGQFLTDDALALSDEGAAFLVHPVAASIRLWGDSQQSVLGDLEALPPADLSDEASKARIGIRGILGCASEPAPLRLACFLGSGDAVTAPIWQAMEPGTALRAWLRNGFVLDPADREWMRWHLEATTRLSLARLAQALDYPRDYRWLAEVLDGARAALTGGHRAAEA
jgi:hypothetical protein